MNYILIFDVIIAALGIYLVFSAWKMKITGEISTLIINSLEISRCKDKESFIASIYSQTIIFGMVSLIFGLLGCINDTVYALGSVFDIGGVVVFIVAWLWFTREVRKKKEQFFY